MEACIYWGDPPGFAPCSLLWSRTVTHEMFFNLRICKSFYFWIASMNRHIVGFVQDSKDKRTETIVPSFCDIASPNPSVVAMFRSR